MVISAAVAVLLAAPAAAQSGPEVHFERLSGVGVQSINDIEPPDGAATDLSVWSTGLSTPLPPATPVPDRWVIVPLVDFEFTRLRFAGDAAELLQDRDLYRVRIGVLNMVQATDRLGVLALVQPGLYSDFGGSLSGDDVGFAAMGLGTWAFSDRTSAGLGAGYVLFFGRPRVVPLGQLKVVRDRVEVDVILPRTASTWWNAHGPAWLGLEASIDGGFYRVHTEHPLAPDAVFQEYSRTDLGGGLQLRLRDKLVVEVTGAAVTRTSVTAYENKNTALVELVLDPGWRVGAQLTVLPPKP